LVVETLAVARVWVGLSVDVSVKIEFGDFVSFNTLPGTNDTIIVVGSALPPAPSRFIHSKIADSRLSTTLRGLASAATAKRV